MNPEAEQQDTTAGEQPPSSGQVPAAEQAGTKPEAKRRAGVPVWRTGKPDAFLAAAVDVARAAVEGITAPADIGAHIAAKSEGDRLVTHLFESRLPGYQGWQWYAVVTRNSRSKVVTVSELGLLPSENSILSPDWVPWAERVRPEDAQEAEEELSPSAEPDTSPAADEDEASEESDPQEDEPAREAD
ncbi:DUF3027 domain-containing protein [Pseudarthrobacter sulfonivorans]|uniref:DUF3027 domain-containing protein n=1 Tax=Pseudarthrobacter sulfonivorans TaxID=121292 RepID=UPI0028652EC5|nr:DUF3027 domain-containing protein [Pseudarthrobacter sulfonivorans]MDR6417316.1 hypothetical protein [Pseudarthrobacter sulfonivorans]